MNFCKIFVNVGELGHREAGLKPDDTESWRQELGIREYRITDFLSLGLLAAAAGLGGNSREQISQIQDGVEVALVNEWTRKKSQRHC